MPMSGYTKLFNSILASTIWRADNNTRIVWITMLAMADKYGIVEGSVPGLADFARVPVEACRMALNELQQPDEDSRSKEQEGRRIEAVEGGWRLINHPKYRAKMNADERREYLRIKQREYRQKPSTRRKQKSTTVNNGNGSSTLLTHASPSPSPDTEANKIKSVRARAWIDRRAENQTPEEKETLLQRAGVFLRETYPTLYEKYRKGARYVGKPHFDFQEALELCRVFDDARLEKLATVFLTTDHQFAENGSRTMAQFRSMASWCDSKLRERDL